MKNDLLIVIIIAITFTLVLVWSISVSPSQTSGTRNELLLGLSEFEVSIDESGKQIYTAKDAKIWVIHPDESWRVEGIVNSDSNVAHKGAIGDVDNDGSNELVGIGGQNATMKVYEYVNGEWQERLIWNPDSTRVRDVEIGDVDNDGKNEIVAGTHDPGIIAIFDYIGGNYIPNYIDIKNSTYVHEVEIYDIDSDGINEIFATITEPNRIGAMPGTIMEYKFGGVGYEKIEVENNSLTNAKEIVAGDVDNDRENELVAIFSCVSNGSDMVLPVQIKKYEFNSDTVTSEVIFNITDVNASTCFITERSAVIGDINNDGLNELVLGTHEVGIYILQFNGTWKSMVIDRDPIAGVHALKIGDFNNDGLNELLSASDGASVLRIHIWRDDHFETTNVLDTPQEDWVWEMDWGDADNI